MSAQSIFMKSVLLWLQLVPLSSFLTTTVSAMLCTGCVSKHHPFLGTLFLKETKRYL
uniref:Uncharacterized protein n=1 Tax=Pyxicephalus adspersus TaxID=30357 RepID=A0AAV3A2C7_PYXAD|nr:TPA: hypothetical protein GDO54_016766 [Pyxicephalus adspersus]